MKEKNITFTMTGNAEEIAKNLYNIIKKSIMYPYLI